MFSSAKRELEYTKNDAGFLVTVPFYLKDDFKSVFKTAKWDSTKKKWQVGTRAEKRLKGFFENLEKVSAELKAANDEFESKELTLEEIKKAEDSLAAILKEKREATAELQEMIESKEAIESCLEKIEKTKNEVAIIEGKKKEAFEEAYKMISQIIDFNKISSAQSAMGSYRNRSNYYNFRNEFDEHHMIVIRENQKLENAGLSSDVLNRFCAINYNRAGRNDRDAIDNYDLSEESIVSSITKIEEE